MSQDVSYPFHDKFQDSIVAHLWRTQGAMAEHEEYFQPNYVSVSTTGVLSTFLIEHYRRYKVLPTEQSLREMIRASHPGLNNDADTRKRNALDQKLDQLRDLQLTDHKYIDEKIREWTKYVAMRNLIVETVEDVKANKYDPELPTKFRNALHIGDSRLDLGHSWTGKVDERVWGNVSENQNPRIPTGLPHLDAMIDGGLQGGELGILLALPKHFKSGTMLNFGYSALRESVGMNVGYITLELSEELVGLRYDCRCALRSKQEMKADPEDFIRVLKNRMDVICGDNQLWIKGFKTKTATCDTIRVWLDRMWAQLGIKIDMLIVDYLDLLKPTRTREKDYLEATDICEDLRSIASKQEYHIPIWTACRATREAVGRRKINMSAMSKSFERVGVADLILALCMTEEEKVKNDMRIMGVAARNDGMDKVVNCKIDYPKYMLTSTGVSDPEFDDDDEGGSKFKKKEKKKDPGERDLKETEYKGDRL